MGGFTATSGLLAAAFAVGLGAGDLFLCPAMTMSATAAAPMFTGAAPYFCDVEDETFGIRIADAMSKKPKAIFATNLFGHAADLREMRTICDQTGTYLIEDNSQSPFAADNGKFAGTIGHIGVFSFNIHKPLQCGEGGMIVTDDDALADRMRDFINHGEVVGGPIGLNLRMLESSAKIMIYQMERAKEIIGGRIEQADAIISAIGDISGIRPPLVRDGCTHVYYTIPFLIDAPEMRVSTGNSDINPFLGETLAQFCLGLKAEGVPIVKGYVPPLYRLPAFKTFAGHCPVAESMHDHRLFYIENCRYSFTPDQIRLIGEAFKRTAEKVL